MSAEQWVIWTRYETPWGQVIRHVYGTWPTRGKALTELRRMKRNADQYGTDLDRVEAHVVKLLEEKP